MQSNECVNIKEYTKEALRGGITEFDIEEANKHMHSIRDLQKEENTAEAR